MTTKRRDLTTGNVDTILRQLTIPMIFGLLGFVIFNLADTYFVSLLGIEQMAALTFTFPVILVINSLNLGIGIGASAIISKAVGEKDYDKVVRLSTDSLSLGVIFATLAMALGLSTISPLFTMLGADASTLVYIKEYMTIWYIGVPFVVIPMIGNSAIRSLGDTKTPSIVMMISAFTNIILDPIMILGLGGFPALGVQGAAIATVMARFITFCFSLYVLILREKVISLKFIYFADLIRSWQQILYIGLPNAVSKMILPIGAGFVTRIVSTYGNESVAGFGIATRIEYFALIVVSSLAAVIPVFVGQNTGGKKYSRIRTALTNSSHFSLINGAIAVGFLQLFAAPLSGLFSSNIEVQKTIELYLRIASFAYAFQGIIMIVTGTLNALGRPILASLLNLGQMLVLYIPLALVGAKFFGLPGIFASFVFSNLVVAGLGYFKSKKIILQLEDDTPL